MSLTLRQTLQKAAAYLRAEARSLRETHTVDGVDWSGEDAAKAEHDECLALAAECRRHAGLEYALVERVDLDRTIESAKPEVQSAVDAINAA